MSNNVSPSHDKERLTASPSNSNTSSSFHSPSPRSKQKNRPRDVWLKAHKGKQLTGDPELEPSFNDFPDDIESVYQAEDMGDNEDSLNDLFIGLNEHQAGPSRLGSGKGKDIRLYNRIFHPSLDEGDASDKSDRSDVEIEDSGEGTEAMLLRELYMYPQFAMQWNFLLLPSNHTSRKYLIMKLTLNLEKTILKKLRSKYGKKKL